MSLSGQIREYIESLVHPSARVDALTTARHRAFIAPRLIGALLALAALPIHLALGGVPGTLEILFYGWLATPILVACYLSRTGRYERAQLMSSISLAGLIAAVGMATGGITSFAAVWLVVIPLEAALSASQRVVMTAGAVALAAAGLLYLFGQPQMLPAAPPLALSTALGVISASLYATGLALGSAWLARTSSRLLMVEEDRYRLLARNITDVITRHRRNGTVRFASPASESLFGVPAKALLGHGLFDRVHVADRPAYLTALSEAAGQGASSSVEFRVRCETAAQGPARFIWVEMRCRALDRAEGEGAPAERDVVAVMRDVTDRKVQERAVEDAREEAERANVAKSHFLATMSHELRTPLNAIIGFSEMLANEEAMQLDKRRRHEYAMLIGESGHHLLSVVNGILDMSKIESGNFEITPEPFALAPVIGTCCDLMALRAREAGVDLVCRMPADLPDIVADKRAVKQIVINLLSNAIKFTGRGGRICVLSEVAHADVIVTVEDSGVGISESDLRHVGDPFFQVRTAYDRPHDGTGLGLSIVKGLVELHGGELMIRSRLGAGTSVAVRLPIDCEKTGRVEQLSNVQRLPLPEPAAAPTDIKVRKRA